MESGSENKRYVPIWLKLVSAFMMGNALVCLFAASLRFFMADKFNPQEPGWLMVIFMLLMAGIFGWTAVGLWRLKNWARKITILIGIIIFLMTCVMLIQHRIFPNPLNWWHFYIYPLILIYLFLPSTKKLFNKT